MGGGAGGMEPAAGGEAAASLWKESFGAARRSRPACLPAGPEEVKAGPAAARRGGFRRRPACPGPLREGGCAPLSPASRAPGSAIFGAGASWEAAGSLGGEGHPSVSSIGRRGFLGLFRPGLRARRGGRAVPRRGWWEPVPPGRAAGAEGRRAGVVVLGTPNKKSGKAAVGETKVRRWWGGGGKNRGKGDVRGQPGRQRI